MFGYHFKSIGILWLLTLSFNLPAANKADLLLVAYDQGESNAFIQLEHSLKGRGISYRILALGRASSPLFPNHMASDFIANLISQKLILLKQR